MPVVLESILGTLHTRNACSVLLTVTHRCVVFGSDAILLGHEFFLLGGAVRTATSVIRGAFGVGPRPHCWLWLWRSPSDTLSTVVGAAGPEGAILSAPPVVLLAVCVVENAACLAGGFPGPSPFLASRLFLPEVRGSTSLVPSIFGRPLRLLRYRLGGDRSPLRGVRGLEANTACAISRAVAAMGM
jgi:hypothetical protein